MTKEEGLAQLKTLISSFASNIDQYRSANYDESNTRAELIDKFFAYLGWDMYNESNSPINYREVVREHKVKIGKTKKAPDYCFRISGKRKFFVEAKKPSVNIKEDIEPAFQARRYAYTAKLPLAILTDFEEFAIYDTRIKPNKNDKANVARKFYWTYNQYEENFDTIYDLFSKEAVKNGSLDKYIEEHKSTKGTSEVDEDLLALIEDWRVDLAKDIAKNNPKLSIFNLNTVVQRIINRIIFLRIAEDKGIEDENLLLTAAKSENVYEHLLNIFSQADIKYNSGLFTKENWINELTIKGDVLKKIIKNLYYPECPYVFSVLPVEILGSIYERFLGKTIHFRNIKGDTHTAIIEEKPEVKKAGGVFYTPQYIVEYIVQNTVGEKIKNKKPEEIAKIKIVDPACGSGSFLVGAYQYLLDYHLDYYTKEKNLNNALKKELIYEMYSSALDGEKNKTYNLTIREKQRILTNSIFGVDIDRQAAQVTKLSLYLKLLENESKEAEAGGWLISHSGQTILPSLEDNIKCGNSLIGTDFNAQLSLNLTDEEIDKVNVFNWETKFPDIFKTGGFDVVIGNPPYVFTRGDGFTEYEKDYYNNKFKQQNYQLNTFAMFTEQGFYLLKNEGNFGFIIPNNWLTISSMKKFRDFIISSTGNLKIVNILHKVFKGANVDTSLLTFVKQKPSDVVLYESPSIDTYNTVSTINYEQLLEKPIIQIREQNNSLKIIDKMIENSSLLGSLVTVSTGLKAYQIGKGKPLQTKKEKEGRVFHSTKKENKTYGKYLQGVDVKRYIITWSGEYLSYGDWLAEPRKSVPYKGARILVRQIPSTLPYMLNGVYTEKPYYNDINSMVIFSNDIILLKFILGILNSKLISFWFNKEFDKLQRNIFPQFKVNELKQFPIQNLDLSKKADKTKHDNLVSLVDKMLELKQRETDEPNPQARTRITNQIESIDYAIDKAVYELYNLTEDEIKVVEGK